MYHFFNLKVQLKKLLILCLLTISACFSSNSEEKTLTLSSGKADRIEQFKSAFVSPRNIDIWLPENYSADKKYAVLYMHDGQMLFDATTTWNKQEWGVDETMSQLLKKGEISNTIVVGIWNTSFRHSEYFPQKPFEKLKSNFQDSLLNHGKRDPNTALFKTKVCSDNYLRFIVQELKPFIDNKYSTFTDAKHTFIAGSSMGGLISMYALCEYPEVFSGAACLSSHWIGTFDTLNNPIPNKFAEYLKTHLPDVGNHRIYFDYGTQTLDALYEPYQFMIDSVLLENGYDESVWITKKFEGENHSEASWRKRLDIPLKFLLE